MKPIIHSIFNATFAAFLSVASVSAHSWVSPHHHGLDLGVASTLDVSVVGTAAPVASGYVDGYVSEIAGFSFFRSYGATVRLTNTVTGARHYAVTQSNGYFRMLVPDGSYSTYASKGARSGTSWGVRIALPFATSARVNFNIR